MTFKEMMAKRLADEGVFDDQIECILDWAMKLPDFCPDMKSHWDANIHDYPSVTSAAILRELWPLAFKWLQRNRPFADFLCQFDPAYPNEPGPERDEFVREYSYAQEELRRVAEEEERNNQ